MPPLHSRKQSRVRPHDDVVVVSRRQLVGQQLRTFFKPIVLGAGFLACFVIIRGAFVVPWALAFRSWSTLASLGRALMIASGLGAVAGAVYAIAGRWLRKIPKVGAYAAGIVTACGYGAALVFAAPFLDDEPRLSWHTADPWLITIVIGLAAGIVLGRQFARKNP